MNTLGTTGNLLSTHEEIVAVCVVVIVRVEHGVEWTSVGRVAVQHVEVGIVLFEDEASKDLLVFSAQILKWLLSETVLGKELNSFLEAEANILALEWCEWVLLTHDLKLFSKASFESIEDGDEHVSKQVENLEIVLVEYHFDIEACELAQVAIGV